MRREWSRRKIAVGRRRTRRCARITARAGWRVVARAEGRAEGEHGGDEGDDLAGAEGGEAAEERGEDDHAGLAAFEGARQQGLGAGGLHVGDGEDGEGRTTRGGVF